jgi:hypothetical protein
MRIEELYKNAIEAEFVKVEKYKIYLILLLLPILCLVLSNFSVMDNNAVDFFSQKETITQIITILGMFLVIFIPLLVPSIMHSQDTGNSESKSINSNSLIPKYVIIFSKILVTLFYTIISIFVTLTLTILLVLYLHLFEGLIVDLEFNLLDNLVFYLLLFPFAVLPYVQLIALIQSFTNNIFLSFIIPFTACLTGNFLYISSYDMLEYSPINLPMAFIKPILSPLFVFECLNFIIILGVCITSILIFSYLIFIRGMNKH